MKNEDVWLTHSRILSSCKENQNYENFRQTDGNAHSEKATQTLRNDTACLLICGPCLWIFGYAGLNGMCKEVTETRKSEEEISRERG